MEEYETYGDERDLAFCAMCGGDTATRDHLPAKVLLDYPLPTPSHIVRSCPPCNNGRSADEDYLACAVEVALRGTVDLASIRRERVRKILRHSPALAAHFAAALTRTPEGMLLNIDHERVSAVLVKIAKGHALYELHQPQYGPPDSAWWRPIHLLAGADRTAFETVPASPLWPEVGSRAMQRIVSGDGGWVVRQPGRYRYLAVGGCPVVVRIVLSEYLAAEIAWHDA